MYKLLTVVLSMALIPAAALAAPPAEKKAGIESKDYKWNAQEGEKIEALKQEGRCQGRQGGLRSLRRLPPAFRRRPSRRHLPAARRPAHDGADQADGRHPHAGLRDNPTMYPFAKELTDRAGTGRTSAYIESLCIPIDHGKYEGPDAAKQIADGKATLREAVHRVPRRQRRRRQGQVLSGHRRPALQVPAAPDDRDS
jgi:hypothetical protein